MSEFTNSPEAEIYHDAVDLSYFYLDHPVPVTPYRIPQGMDMYEEGRWLINEFAERAHDQGFYESIAFLHSACPRTSYYQALMPAPEDTETLGIQSDRIEKGGRELLEAGFKISGVSENMEALTIKIVLPYIVDVDDPETPPIRRPLRTGDDESHLAHIAITGILEESIHVMQNSQDRRGITSKLSQRFLEEHSGCLPISARRLAVYQDPYGAEGEGATVSDYLLNTVGTPVETTSGGVDDGEVVDEIDALLTMVEIWKEHGWDFTELKDVLFENHVEIRYPVVEWCVREGIIPADARPPDWGKGLTLADYSYLQREKLIDLATTNSLSEEFDFEDLEYPDGDWEDDF